MFTRTDRAEMRRHGSFVLESMSADEAARELGLPSIAWRRSRLLTESAADSAALAATAGRPAAMSRASVQALRFEEEIDD